MDRPPSKVWPITKVVLVVAASLVALFLIFIAIRLVFGYFSPDDGDGPGNAGHLFSAAFYLVLAGPFVAIALALGLPMISSNPKWKG